VLGLHRRFEPVSRAVFATAVILVGAVTSTNVAQGRVDLTSDVGATEQSEDTVSKATGGGTVFANPLPDRTVSSFGLNARRPVGFTTGGFATGRINYDRHRGGAGRHVNAPVIFMESENSGTPGPNGTGGRASIIADCTVGGSTCPLNNAQAIVYVEDNSDSGANSDIFRIWFCTVAHTLPLPDLSDPNADLGGCTGPEGGPLRSGNIQVRAQGGLSGETAATAAGAGPFTSTPSLGGVELAGGTFGVGVRTASGSGYGDVEVQFNGISLLGMFQQVTVNGWITSVTSSGGTVTMNGTCTLDMGDGVPPASGVPLVATLTASGITLTIGSTALPTLPKSDGFINIE
jgi:hypothetical protein